MINLGAKNYDDIAWCAVSEGRREIVKKMLKYKLSNYGQLVLIALRNKYNDIAKDIFDVNMNVNMNEIALEATKCGYKDMVVKVVERGANNYKEIINKAIEYNNPEIADTIVRML